MSALPRTRARWAGGGAYFAMLVVTGIVVFNVAVAISVLTETDAAAWVEALSTFAAFLAAGVAVYYAFQSWTIEDQREQDRAEGERRSQAALVAGWISTPVADENEGPLPRYEARDWELELRNASELPVYGLRVEYVANLSTVKNQRLRPEKVELGTQHLGLLPPGPVRTVTPEDHVRRAFEAQLADRYLVVPPRITVQLSFRDADEERWIRDHSGRLKPGVQASAPRRPPAAD